MEAILALVYLGCAVLILCGIAFEKFGVLITGAVFALLTLMFTCWYAETTGFSAYCATCDKEYELEYRYCPMDGTELTIQ